MTKGDFKNIFFLFYLYIRFYNKKSKNIYKIFFLLTVSFFMICLINSFSFGLLTYVEKSVINGYGDIYFEFKSKMNLKEIKKKKIESRLQKCNDISSFFLYGINNGMLKHGNDYIPIYLISYVNLNNVFYNKKYNSNENGFYVGALMYEKYKNISHKKIFLIKKENTAKKIIHFDYMPINFKGYLELAWDELNEKAIFMPIEKVENFFELRSINAVNIYLLNRKNINSVMTFLKNEFGKEIGYISESCQIFPEYSKFLSLISIIDAIIMYIIFIFSFFLFLILLTLYLEDNVFDQKILFLLGIKRKTIYGSFLILFLFVIFLSLLLGFLLSYGVIYCINYWKLIPINTIFDCYFLCVMNFKKILLYTLIYIFLMIIFVMRAFNKKYFY